MIRLIFVIIGFIILSGLILITIEAYNAPLMDDDEVTVLVSKK